MPRAKNLEKKKNRHPIVQNQSEHIYKELSIQNIKQPGCYIDHLTGNLIRVSPDMLRSGMPFQGFLYRQSWNVTKISSDYELPTKECRILAANASLKTNF